MSFALIEFFDIRMNIFEPVSQTRDFALLAYSSRVAGGLSQNQMTLAQNVYRHARFGCYVTAYFLNIAGLLN